MRILVQPERLRQAAQAFRQAQQAWQGQAARLRQVFSGLDWEVRQQLTVEAQVQRAISLAESLAAHAGEQAAFLEAAAARFEQADSQGAQAIGAVLGASAFSAIGGLHLPLGLSSWSGERIPVTRVLALSGGGEVAGLGLFASFAWLGSAVLWFVQAIWNWLRGYPVPIASPLPSERPKSKLAEIIRRGLEQADQRRTSEKSGQHVDDRRASPSRQITAADIEEARRKLASNPDMTNMWRQVDAPIKSTLDNRSPDLYRAVIEQFDVEHSHPGRYRPSAQYPDTRCNIFVGDVMRAMGAPLPTKGELYNTKDPMTANAKDIHAALSRGWGGWRRIDINNPADRQLLLEHLRQGKPAVASDPGHIAVLRPDQPAQINTPADLRIAQAGARNANNISLGEAGYGSCFQPDFFIHD